MDHQLVKGPAQGEAVVGEGYDGPGPAAPNRSGSAPGTLNGSLDPVDPTRADFPLGSCQKGSSGLSESQSMIGVANGESRDAGKEDQPGEFAPSQP